MPVNTAFLLLCSIGLVVGGGDVSFMHGLLSLLSPPAWSKETAKPLEKALFWSTKPSFLSASKNEESPRSSSNSGTVVGVVAPLKYAGPFVGLGLQFPGWWNNNDNKNNKTKNNQNNNENNQTTAASTKLHFVLDTGASVNSIRSSLVQQFDLPLVYSMSTASSDQNNGGNEKNTPPRLVGTTGIKGAGAGDLHLLGNAQLQGMPQDSPLSNTTFVSQLVAASLPLASPVGAGVLGMSFFQLFAGVEFDWYGTDGDPPTIIFYYHPPKMKMRMNLDSLPSLGKSNDDDDVAQRVVIPALLEASGALRNTTGRVPLNSTGVMRGGLFTLPITLSPANFNSNEDTRSNNSFTVQALLDTGSPLTVLSKGAARLAGIKACEASNGNKQQQQVLKIAGVDGGQMDLQPSRGHVRITLAGKRTVVASKEEEEEDVAVSLGQGPVFVGDLAVFGSVLDDAGEDSDSRIGDTNMGVSAILGLDFLRRNIYRMVLSTAAQSLWLEEFLDCDEDGSQPKWSPRTNS